MCCETRDSGTLIVKFILFTHMHVYTSLLARTFIDMIHSLAPDLKLNLTLTLTLKSSPKSQKALSQRPSQNISTFQTCFHSGGLKIKLVLTMIEIPLHTLTQTEVVSHLHDSIHKCITLACFDTHAHTRTKRISAAGIQKCAHTHTHAHTSGTIMCVHLCFHRDVFHLTLQKKHKKTTEHLSSCGRSPLHHFSITLHFLVSSLRFICCFFPLSFINKIPATLLTLGLCQGLSNIS